MTVQKQESRWTCCEKVFDDSLIIEHLRSVHGLALSRPNAGVEVMVMAGDGWSINTLEHTVGEVVLHQMVTTNDDETIVPFAYAG